MRSSWYERIVIVDNYVLFRKGLEQLVGGVERRVLRMKRRAAALVVGIGDRRPRWRKTACGIVSACPELVLSPET
jgi:hypothetical protein